MSLEQQAMVLEQIAGRMTDAQVLELGHFAVRLVFCGDAQHGCMVLTASLGWGKP